MLDTPLNLSGESGVYAYLDHMADTNRQRTEECNSGLAKIILWTWLSVYLSTKKATMAFDL